MSTKDNERANVTFNLPSRLITKLREECRQSGQDVNKVVEVALLHWLAGHMGPAKADVHREIEELLWRVD